MGIDIGVLLRLGVKDKTWCFIVDVVVGTLRIWITVMVTVIVTSHIVWVLLVKVEIDLTILFGLGLLELNSVASQLAHGFHLLLPLLIGRQVRSFLHN
jgi:hypothetical protein